MYEGKKITIRGRVQGVGFRPFIYKLASEEQLQGTVQNNLDGVKVRVQGEKESITRFCERILEEKPRLARIDFFEQMDEVVGDYEGFSIIPSEDTGASTILIPSDAALCVECRDELLDKENVRYHYPFINCTQCGPRYTIIQSLPYDRPKTSMKIFPMCPTCQTEYEDVQNRRHHAQPIACPTCGPKLQYIAEEKREELALEQAISDLQNGKIVAIKGIGGFHLACDATNEKSIERLRNRKKRGRKPFAIMAKNIESIKEICDVLPEEEKLLTSVEAPIVLLTTKENHLPSTIAPGMKSLGVMLPYTPLHTLLFECSSLSYLVMTSGNISGCPILSLDNEDTYKELLTYSDSILTNNRDIVHSIDDSVVAWMGEQVSIIRRGRGYAPDSFFLKEEIPTMFAYGAQQKNTFAISKGKQVFVGPHIGDCETIETINHWLVESNHMNHWLQTRPKIGAMDKHPTYTINGQKKVEQAVEIQHHHAHMASAMVEHHLSETCFGVILDGTGYGDDGHIWGFEILEGNLEEYTRRAHLRYTPLIGGERSVRSPKQNSIGMLLSLFPGKKGIKYVKEIFHLTNQEVALYQQILEKNLHTPLAGTCGRLFDSVSAILGICSENSYDGEGAILLSEVIRKKQVMGTPYSYKIRRNEQVLEIDFSDMLEEIISDYLNKRMVEDIILDFHETIVKVIVHLITELNDKKAPVILSGGSFMNPYLLNQVKHQLEENQYVIYTNQLVPCNDGGLSLGQLGVAAARVKGGRKVCV